METIHLAHVPPELAIHVVLYQNVQNTAFLKEQLLAGNTDFEYAFIDAKLIISRRHALSAAFRAVNDYMHHRLKSKNVHSEIVFALSSTNNIGEAFRRFGIGDETKDLVVFKVATRPDLTADVVQNHLSQVIEGLPVAFVDEQLRSICDWACVREIYKLPVATAGKKAIPGDSVMSTDEMKTLEVQILGLMALRGAT